jgi:hypothetical protein
MAMMRPNLSVITCVLKLDSDEGPTGIHWSHSRWEKETYRCTLPNVLERTELQQLYTCTSDAFVGVSEVDYNARSTKAISRRGSTENG